MKKLILTLAILGATLCHAQINKSKYDFVNERFSEGLARVELNEKWGFINTRGEKIIPLKYDDAEDFKNGIAKIKEGNEWYKINTKGEIVKELE